MNDLELQSRLRSVPVPARPDGYWDDFPSRIRWQLPPRRCEAPRRPAGRRPLVWAARFAVAAALALVSVQHHPWRATAATITQHEHALHTQLARLDVGLHKLMLNTDGMGNLLTDAN